VIRTKKYLL